jgi:hypothetical protein
VPTVIRYGNWRRRSIAAVTALSLAAAFLATARDGARAGASTPTGSTSTASTPTGSRPTAKVKPVAAEPTVASAQLHAREQASRVLISADQTATSQTFANPDGS